MERVDLMSREVLLRGRVAVKTRPAGQLGLCV